MAISQKTGMEQRQVMRLSQQQLRFVRMLEYTAPELDEAVERELEDNPALEATDTFATATATVSDSKQPAASADSMAEAPAAWTPAPVPHNSAADDRGADYITTMAVAGESMYDTLGEQLAELTLDDNVRKAAEYIIGNLDSNGYLRRTVQQLADDMAFGPGLDVDTATVEEALEAVRALDPPGLGAYDLRQTLELQLERKPQSQTRDDALRILREQFDAFSKKHTHRLPGLLGLAPERVERAISLILSLNPKPGSALGGSADRAAAIVPDVLLGNAGGHLTVTLNNRLPELRIDATFEQAVQQMKATAASKQRGERRGNEFVTTRYNDARDFIRILRQRQQTLLEVVAAIVSIQRDYFLTGDVYRLKPMMIKDISAMTGHDLSVVSRATNNKYMSTPTGVYPLRFFFSDSIGDDSAGASESQPVLTNRKMEAEIEALVDAEDKSHPLSDEKIREEMAKRGYEVSRRTVAKYRDRVGIPVARLRRKM